MQNLKPSDIEALNDQEINNALTQPHLPRLGTKIFYFLRENDNLTTVMSGMTSIVTGLNRFELAGVAPLYSIKLSKYLFAVSWYETELLKVYAELQEK